MTAKTQNVRYKSLKTVKGKTSENFAFFGYYY